MHSFELHALKHETLYMRHMVQTLFDHLKTSGAGHFSKCYFANLTLATFTHLSDLQGWLKADWQCLNLTIRGYHTIMKALSDTYATTVCL